MEELKLSTFWSKTFEKVSFDFSSYPGLTDVLNTERLFLLNLGTLIQIIINFQTIIIITVPILYYLIAVQWLPLWKEQNPDRFPWMQDLWTVWNLVMTVISFLGALRLWPEFIYMIQNYGWLRSMCDDRYYDDARIVLWMILFPVITNFSLIDTGFWVVVRGRQPPASHYLIRMLLTIYHWLLITDFPSNYRWLATLHFTIHSISYFYNAMVCTRGRRPIPKFLGAIVHVLQIIQMFVVSVIELMTFTMPETDCAKAKWLSTIGFSVHLTSVILLSRSFQEKYLVKQHIKNE